MDCITLLKAFSKYDYGEEHNVDVNPSAIVATLLYDCRTDLVNAV